jgi:pimeloyl-ACP methyl ester carboxylesterase
MLFGLAGVDMPPTLLLLHGWGFDAGVWDGLVAALPGWPVLRGDLGYFGAGTAWPAARPALAVGHSLGAMLLARALPAVPLVAINGFDRFCGAEAVAPRVLARMRRRFAQDPQAVLDDFRAGCGAAPAAQRAIPPRWPKDWPRWPTKVLRRPTPRACWCCTAPMIRSCPPPCAPPPSRRGAGGTGRAWPFAAALRPAMVRRADQTLHDRQHRPAFCPRAGL